MSGGLLALVAIWQMAGPAPELEVELIGNAGVVLSDGEVSLLLDLPYEPGAFGYMRYSPDRLQPSGSVVSVITHHHRDHFAADLFLARNDWRVIGPPSVVDPLPPGRVFRGDSLAVGEFSVIALPTPHTADHRSYRVRWRGRLLYFVGDTEDPAAVSEGPRPHVLFITPWLSCSLATTGSAAFGERSILYHRRPDGSDRVCGPVESLEQGSRFTLIVGGAPSATGGRDLKSEAVGFVDSLTVSRFETDLPDMPTVQWFEETIGTEAVLELDDCGEGTGDPESASADQPLCVSIAGSLVDGRTVGVSIQVGNANQGLVAPPFVRMIWITDPRGPEFLSSLEELGARFAGRR